VETAVFKSIKIRNSSDNVSAILINLKNNIGDDI
jgi:hypothetical protein